MSPVAPLRPELGVADEELLPRELGSTEGLLRLLRRGVTKVRDGGAEPTREVPDLHYLGAGYTLTLVDPSNIASAADTWPATLRSKLRRSARLVGRGEALGREEETLDGREHAVLADPGVAVGGDGLASQPRPSIRRAGLANVARVVDVALAKLPAKRVPRVRGRAGRVQRSVLQLRIMHVALDEHGGGMPVVDGGGGGRRGGGGGGR